MKKLLLALLALLLCSCSGGWYPNDTTFLDERLEEQEIQEEISINETIEADPCQQDMLDGVPPEYSRCDRSTESIPVEPTAVDILDDPAGGCEYGDENSTGIMGNFIHEQTQTLQIPAPYSWVFCLESMTYEKYRTGIFEIVNQNGGKVLEERDGLDTHYLLIDYGSSKTLAVYFEPTTTAEPAWLSIQWLTVERASTINTGCTGGCQTHVEGCNIKGNISVNDGEKIYHMPGQEYYYETVIDTDYGERWFCTEREAIDAGWRKARE